MIRATFRLLLLGSGLAACSAERAERGPVGAGEPAPLLSTASASPAAPARVPQDPLDLESFTPILALPELAAASAALDASDPAAAARAVEAAVGGGKVEPARVPSYRLLVGRLRLAAGDLPGALQAFDSAAIEPWPLSGYARAAAGRVLARLGRNAEALERFAGVAAEPPLSRDLLLDVAEAKRALGDGPGALAAYRSYADGRAFGPPGVPVLLHFGTALADEGEAQAATAPERGVLGGEALAMTRRIDALAPALPPDLAELRKLRERALALIPEGERAARAVPTVAEDLERLRALTESKQFEAARPAGEALLGRLGPSGRESAQGCEVALLLARAFAGTREPGKGADLLGSVVPRCGDADLSARALFLAGKYSEQDKRFAEAARLYEKLESDYPRHRLADDARLRRALAYQELGADARYTELLSRMPDDFPDGDMVLDGSFELSLGRMKKGDWAGALAVLERAAKAATTVDVTRGQELAGRERYFLGRALERTGDAARAAAAYEDVVRTAPLSYYMLHAYSRLWAADPARAKAALAEGLAGSERAPFVFEWRSGFGHPGFVRALELLRVGAIDEARGELEASGVVGPDVAPAILWGVALLYERAGSGRLSHALAKASLTDWLSRWPGGSWKRAWQAAFPRPYAAVVAREVKRSGVPEPLVYAVMREESAFDPEAESPARAYGLMQLIEPTAIRYGKAIGLRGDAASLKRPAVNVAIGCRVLADLARSFSDNPLLAVPGYNAGPGRPRRWAADRPDQDFDLWVELIPFTETRRYTKRVLASRATYTFLYGSEGEAAMHLPLPVLPKVAAAAP